MYSSFNRSNDFKVISKGEMIYEKLKNWKTEVFFLKRNPYKRLESFYKDKILQNLPQEIKDYQNCQALIYNFMIKSKINIDCLENLDYEQFIKILPEIYLSDFHLQPQYYACSTFGYYWGNFINQIDIGKIENVNKIDSFFKAKNQYTNITNSTQFYYTKSMEEIINNLYRNDFKYLKYGR